MTDALRPARSAYDESSSPAQLSADCRAAEERLGLPARFATVARAAARGPVSLRFEDFREARKPDIDPTLAARRIAAALDLGLD
jgi:hypothetical protein